MTRIHDDGRPATLRSLDVLIVAQPVIAGVAVCVRQLTEAAVAAGHRVTVVCPSADRGPLAGWVLEAGARHEPLDMVRHPSLRDVSDVWAIRRLAKGRDLVHLHSSKAGALGRAAVATLGRRRPVTVFTPHYWSWLVGGPLAGLYRLIERILARFADAIVAVSQEEADGGLAALGTAADRITVIGNGVDRDHFTPEGFRTERDPEAPLVVCVGRLSEQKGQDVAVRALALLQDRTARLRLVGGENQGGERKELEALAADLGVGDRVEFRGEVSDTAPELRAADLVIAPSRWEGMSLVFLEALACGAPMVVSDVYGSGVVDGAGVVVPRDDAQALAQAIDEVLGDDRRRRRMGEAARDRSRAFDLATTLRRNLELWAELVHRAAVRPDVAQSAR